MNVLIVDDIEINRRLLRANLEAAGIDTFEAEDGVAALAALERSGADVIISDVLMPNMDGYRLCQEVRSRQRLREIPLIIYTGTYLSPSDEKLALDCGVDRYIKKPAPMSVIAAAVRELAGHGARSFVRNGHAGGTEVMKEYSEALVRKLEEKNEELHSARDELMAANTGLLRRKEELTRAKEVAEAASRAKSEFLANMGHEIRTPMNGLLGTLNLLIPGEFSQERLDLMKLAKASAESLLIVLNDILAYSKLEAGVCEKKSVFFSLRQCIGAQVDVLTHFAAAKGLAIDYRVACNTPDVLFGDCGRLGQILRNLLENAVKFTERGRVGVNVDVESRTTDEVCLRFEVMDTGIGISSCHLQHIFEAFTQVDASTTRAQGGVGLGLAIVRRLVEIFGGRTWVQSEPGRGSSFHFTATFGVDEASQTT